MTASCYWGTKTINGDGNLFVSWTVGYGSLYASPDAFNFRADLSC